MLVNQVAEAVNAFTSEYLGEEALVTEDLSNIVDIGSKVVNLDNLDNYVKRFIDQIGKITFQTRPYEGVVPSLYTDPMEYGAILEDITYGKLPEAQENDSWKLQAGQSYDPNIFTPPDAHARFYSNKQTFDIPMSYATEQVKSAFRSRGELMQFSSMIETAVSNSMTVKTDAIAMRAYTSRIANTIHAKANTPQCINLLARYNAQFGKSLTQAECLYDKEFVRYASLQITLFCDRLRIMTKLFNQLGYDRFTPAQHMKLILLSEFEKAARTYLYSDTFNDEYVKIPRADAIAFWQGPGLDFEFSSTSRIAAEVMVTTVDGDTETKSKETVDQTGVLGILFDHRALLVTNLRRWVTTNYNGRADFMNYWYKFDVGQASKLGENFVVFYAA
jgi:hypothetical protein